MAGASQGATHLEGPASQLPLRGPLDGHPEASVSLHKAVKGLERQLAGVLASSLTPLSEEVVRLREQRITLEAENRRFREILEEAGLGFKLPPPGETEDLPSFRPQRRRLTQPGARRQRSTSPGANYCITPSEASTKGEVNATPQPSPRGTAGARKPTLLAPVAASTSSPSGDATKDQPAVTIAVTDDTPLRASLDGQPEQGSMLSAAPEVELQPIWKDMNNAATIKKGIFHRAKVPMKTRAGSFLGVRKENLEKLILPPTSHIRMVWEAIGAISIIYDLVTVPLQAFNVYTFTNFLEQLRHTMIYLHICYWTLDLPCSFFVGYYVNGVLETRVKKTAKRYLTSWFFVDICLVSCDWTMFFIEITDGTEPSSLSYLMYGRILRLLRFVRLVRLLKLHNMFNKILESIHSEYALTFMRVSEHVLLIVCLNHFIACAWYWIGTQYSPYEATWIDKFNEEDTTSYRYTTALHWSLTQFTPASMEVVPKNVGERSYNVCVVILAMVIFSTFISSITEAMTRLRKSNGLKAAQYQDLRQYLGENQVSMQLAMRIWRYLENGSKARRQRKMWRDVELVHEIPDTLQMDLHHEVYLPVFQGHPFFLLYSEQSPVAMRTICHYATQEISLVAEQVLFSEEQVADKMYFVIEGLLEYQVFAGSELSGVCTKKQKLTYRDWLCEAVIWIKWHHHGTATAKQLSSLVALNATTLHSIMKEYLGTIPYDINYAERFAEYVRNHPTGMCDVEEDDDRIETMAQEAYDQVENTKNPTCTPNPVQEAPRAGTKAASRAAGRHRVTWGHRSSLGSMFSRQRSSVTRRSGSGNSGLFSFLQGNPCSGSSASLESARQAPSATHGSSLGRNGGVPEHELGPVRTGAASARPRGDDSANVSI